MSTCRVPSEAGERTRRTQPRLLYEIRRFVRSSCNEPEEDPVQRRRAAAVELAKRALVSREERSSELAFVRQLSPSSCRAEAGPPDGADGRRGRRTRRGRLAGNHVCRSRELYTARLERAPSGFDILDAEVQNRPLKPRNRARDLIEAELEPGHVRGEVGELVVAAFPDLEAEHLFVEPDRAAQVGHHQLQRRQGPEGEIRGGFGLVDGLDREQGC